MSDAQINVIEGDQAQVVLAPGENPAIVASIPGPQGPAGAGVPTGGAANEVLYKVTSTFGDTAWGPITSAMIGDLQIVNADVSASAAIAGTKISPNFGSQNVVTTGTSTAASFIPTSSTAPTNGLYLSAANSVSVATNSTGRLFVDASGNVGVNAAPTYRFDVSNGGASAAAVRILGNDQSNVRLRLQNSGSGGRAYEIVGGSNAANNSHFTIYDATAAATRLAISNTGLVGVGTASPSQLLHVRGNALVTGSGGWTTNEEANIYLGDIYGSLSYDFNTTNLKTKSFGSTSFLTGGTSPTERLRITSTGQLSHIGAGSSGSPAVSFSGSAGSNSLVVDSNSRVGIGTSSPVGRLHSVAATTNAALTLATPDTGVARLAHLVGGNNYSYGVIGIVAGDGLQNGDAYGLGSSSNSTGTFSPTLTWTTSNGQNQPGRVGIGSNAPQANLVVSNGGAAGLEVNPAGYDSGPILQAFNRSTSAYVPLNTYSSYVAFNTGSSAVERARIDTSGRLLVGTASDSGGALLQVNGNRIRIATAKTPASATDTGVAGEICWDADYIYVCTATNTWKRTAISTWP